MNELRIEVQDDRDAFEPGDELNGRVYWVFESLPRNLELRLFWFTRGKGTEDARVEDSVKFDNPSAAESRAFRFRLPASPYSFSGKLISLVWALELVAQPAKAVSRRELVIAPAGREVLLSALPESEIRKRWFARKTR